MSEKKWSPGQSSIAAHPAGLYASTTLRSLTYRDFTASRIETRARFRRRVLKFEAAIAESGCGKAGGAPPPIEFIPLADAARNPVLPGSATPTSPARDVLRDDFGSDVDAQPECALPPGDAFYAATQVERPTPHEEVVAPARPQWLDPLPEPPAVESLLDARERIASRWFALNRVLAPTEGASPSAAVRELPAPAIVFFSIAGGVGKTSIAAGLGRAMAACGERVLLADLTNSGLLPFYFGSRDLKPGTVRTFLPPEGSGHASVYLLTLDASARKAEWELALLFDEIHYHAPDARRILIDIQTSDMVAAEQLASLDPVFLMPLLADMNSVVSLGAMESAFAGRRDGGGRALQVFYLLNQFDSTSPLHLDVREILQRQLGNRLLPFVIRNSPAVSEALAEGMTVMDYAPNDSVTNDYLQLAHWVESVAPIAAHSVVRGPRWSER